MRNLKSPDGDVRRDIELILLGVLLSKADREKVLTLTPGSFSKEFEPCVEGIRSNVKENVMAFYKSKGVTPEKGKDLVDALVGKIADLNKRERLRHMASQLANTELLEVDKAVEHFKRILKQVEAM